VLLGLRMIDQSADAAAVLDAIIGDLIDELDFGILVD